MNKLALAKAAGIMVIFPIAIVAIIIGLFINATLVGNILAAIVTVVFFIVAGIFALALAALIVCTLYALFMDTLFRLYNKFSGPDYSNRKTSRMQEMWG